MAPENPTACQERDRILLAFLLAMNEGHNASSDLESAQNDEERSEALHTCESAKGHCHRLRSQVLDHCLAHGC